MNPHSTLGLRASFGFGDRTGLATPGHVLAMTRAGDGIAPIFAQQSIREMTRTGRTPEAVIADALAGMATAGWKRGGGADADHLKTPDDIERTVAAGFTFFTLDPSAHVDPSADTLDLAALRAKRGALGDRVAWVDAWAGKRVTLTTGTVIDFTEEVLLRAAVKYGAAAVETVRLAAEVADRTEKAGRDHEIELSVDETDWPTSPAEHLLVADYCLSHGVRLVSLAPRFPGHFEKGVDFRGDQATLEQALADHAAIAELLGPYKLSLHSGSDKLSMYAAFARATKGRFHVKTAGTSYLEALRVAARHDEKLFRAAVTFARERYDTDKATYHVSATLADGPVAEGTISVRDLETAYLGDWNAVPAGAGFTGLGRQILHCTFGSTLNHPSLGPDLKGLLATRQDAYTDLLADHFVRHLEALRSGLRR
jgi:hypothetical protein